MTEEKKRKKKKKQKQIALAKHRAVENPKFAELLQVLEALENEQKYVDLQICPRCKSPRVRRAGTLSGDMSGHMGLLPVKHKCVDCGWQGRLVLTATNRKMGVKDVAIIAEALDLKVE